MANDLLPDLVRIPAGSFLMGSDEGEEDERPRHQVYLDEFYLGARQVTNEEYARFVTETGHRPPGIDALPLVVSHGGRDVERVFRQIAAAYLWPDGRPRADRLSHPVTLVRWQDAVAYCRWLANAAKLPIRLPTEAEWEKAARGGLDGQPYPWGSQIGLELANYLIDPSLKFARGTQPVGSYPPNGYSLYDMAGNVWEWVADWYDPAYYASSPPRNPPGPADGRLRIVRGGGWVDADVRRVRCSYRHKVPDDTYSYSIGFRVACSSTRLVAAELSRAERTQSSVLVPRS